MRRFLSFFQKNSKNIDLPAFSKGINSSGMETRPYGALREACVGDALILRNRSFVERTYL